MASNISDFAERIDRDWEKLTFSNDFIFCKTMLNPELCKEVLETILDMEIEHIEYVGRQETIDTVPGDKTIRLDVYVRDGEGTMFNVEMQTTDKGELPRRTRYYQSLIALDQIKRGESYYKLGDAYVIFICKFDLFGRGRRVYSFENACLEEAIALGDGAHTIFLAAPVEKGSPRDKLDEFLDYVATGKVSGEFSERLDKAVKGILDSRKWRLEYMMLEARDQLNYGRGREEGYSKGVADGYDKGQADGYDAGKADGYDKGQADGYDAGKADGYDKGQEDAQKRIAGLVNALIAQGRGGEIPEIIADPKRIEELCQSYGIE